MNRINLFVLLTATLLGASSAFATPAEVLIIRHAEKPSEGNELSAKGRKRAQALVGFFESDSRVTRFGTPVAIYASSPKSEDGALRAIETAQPTADDLGLKLRTDFHKKDYDDMVSEIMDTPRYDGKTVLIVWSHDEINNIAHSLGVHPQPDKWDGDVFDRVWRLDFKGKSLKSFDDLPQRVLPGDSKR